MTVHLPQYRRVFLHFFDIHFLEMLGLYPVPPQMKDAIESECALATRLAILCCDEIYLPAASYIEADICYRLISEFEDLFQYGLITLMGGGTNIAEFLEEKLRQYKRQSVQFKRYKSALRILHKYPPFAPRKASATNDIVETWRATLKSGNIGHVVKETGFCAPNEFESRWESVPERLEGKAFVPDYVRPLLFSEPAPSLVINRVRSLINASYFGSFTRELCAGVVDSLVYLAAPNDIPTYGENIPYKQLLAECRLSGLIKPLRTLPAEQLLSLKKRKSWQECLAAAYVKYQNDKHTRSIYMDLGRNELDHATLGIITALPEEFVAACQALACGDPLEVPGSGAGRKYAVGRVQSRAGVEHIIAVAMLTDAGNNSAAIRAIQMMEHCRQVKRIIMCGIAGAVPNPNSPADHVRLGDIVVCDRGGVIQYDYVKRSRTVTETRHAPRPPAASLLEAAKWLKAAELKGEKPWQHHIDSCLGALGARWNRPGDDKDRLLSSRQKGKYVDHPHDPGRTQGEPRVFYGPIASANVLLKDPVLRDSLRDRFKVKAVEMEGSGIADATWNLERGYLVIRGTCDYCDSGKNDEWHNYSSILAAAYCRALIEILGKDD